MYAYGCCKGWLWLVVVEWPLGFVEYQRALGEMMAMICMSRFSSANF